MVTGWNFEQHSLCRRRIEEGIILSIQVSSGSSNDRRACFRVKAVNAEGASDPLATEEATLAKNPYERPDKPDAPDITDWDSDHVDLKWKAPNDVNIVE